MRSEWLRRAVVVDGGIRFPGRGVGHRSCDLVLTDAGATVSHGDTRGVLAWEDHRPDIWKGVSVTTGWGVCLMHSLQVVSIGVVGSTSSNVEEVVRASRGGVFTSMGASVPFAADPTAVDLPLETALWRAPHLDFDRAGLQALCSVIAARPEARGRLTDRSRCHRLVEELQRSRLREVTTAGITSAATDTITALKALGFVHPVGGRPVPGDVVEAEDIVVDRVLERLRASPYHADGIDEAAVRRTVRRVYTDVEPWPFGALTQS